MSEVAVRHRIPRTTLMALGCAIVLHAEHARGAARSEKTLGSALSHIDDLSWACDEAENARVAFEEAHVLLREHPESYEAAWRLARAGFLAALAAEDEDTKAYLGYAGYEASLQAVELGPERAEAYYWGACALSVYGQNAGVLAVLTKGVLGTVREFLEEAVRLHRTLDEGAPLEALGRYWCKVPWPLRDLDRAVELLLESVELAPERLRRRAYLADAYRAKGDERLAATHYRICAGTQARTGKRTADEKWREHCAEEFAKLKEEGHANP